MERKVLKPKSGLLVRDPVSKLHLKAEGEEKNMTNYWVRRVACGDVEVVESKPDLPAKKVSKN